MKYPVACIRAALLCLLSTLPAMADTPVFHVQPTWRSMDGVRVEQRRASPIEETPTQDDAGGVVVEAESAANIVTQRGQAGSVVAMADAGGGAALRFVEHAMVQFHVSRGGAYRLWFRLQVPRASAWNFHAALNGAAPLDVKISPDDPAGQWFWRGSDEVTVKPGIQRLQLSQVFNGKAIDQIMLLPAAMPAPVGLMPPSPRLAPVSPEALGSVGVGWVEGMRWRASPIATEAGLEFQEGGAWRRCDDQWRDQPSPLRLALTDRDRRLDQVQLEVQAPTDTICWQAGDGDVLFGPALGRIIAIRGRHVQSSLLSDEPAMSLTWYSPEASGDRAEQPKRSRSEEWRWLGGDGTREPLIYEHAPTAVRMELTAEPGPEVLTLRVVAVNHGTYQVTALGFPHLPAVLAADPTTAQMVWPAAYPVLIARPESVGEQVMPYPRAAFNAITLGDHEQSFYLASLDPDLRMNEHRSRSAPFEAGNLLSMTLLDRLGPGQTQKRTIVMGVRPGNWRGALRHYGDWVNATFGPSRPPRWMTRSLGWYAVMTQAISPLGFWGERDADIDLPWFLGLDQVQMWGHGPILTCCPNYYYPDPGRGGPQALTRYLATLRGHGLRVGTYFHPHSINPIFTAADQFRGQAVAQIPGELRPPSVEWFKHHYRRNHVGDAPQDPDPQGVKIMQEQGGGQETNGKVPRLFMDMDWSEPWQNYVETWITRYLREYGIQTPYLDVWGLRPKYQSFNESTVGFGRGDQGKHMLGFLDRLHEVGAQTAGEDFGFFYEGYTDVWSQRGASLLSHGAPQSIEVIKAVFPRQIAIIGGNNGYWRPVEVQSRQLGRALVDGHLMDVILPAPPFAELLWMREALRPWYDATTYRIDDGVVDAPDDWLVRQHLDSGSEVRDPGFAMWCWFNPTNSGGAVTLSPPTDRPCRWFALSSRGESVIVQPRVGATRLDLPAGRGGAVLAVWDEVATPQAHITLLRSLPRVDGFDHVVTTLNVRAAALALTVAGLGPIGDGTRARMTLNAAAHAVAQQSVHAPAGTDRRQLRVTVVGEDYPRRRLDGPTVLNPANLVRTHRPYVADHPDRPGVRTLKLDAKVADRQVLFWPPDQTGTLSLRIRRDGDATFEVRMESECSGPTSALLVRDGQGWQEIQVPFRTGPDDLWLELKLTNLAPERGAVWIESMTAHASEETAASKPSTTSSAASASSPVRRSTNQTRGVTPP